MDTVQRHITPQAEETLNGQSSKGKSNVGWFSDCSTPTSNELVYLSQMLFVFIVILTSLYNLTTKTGDDSLWTALLTSCLGYILPNPKINKH